MVLVSELSSDAKVNVAERPTLKKIAYEGNLDRRRTAELHNILYGHGPGNGTMLILPFDHLVGGGMGHTLSWERCADPRAIIELANRGNFSALALSIGQAEKYQNLIRPDLPLIIKVDGHFLAGKEVSYPTHSVMSSVERAIRAGANAIGCFISVGNEKTGQDVERISKIIDAAHQHGKPVFLWAYAQGPWPDAMGADSLFWCAQCVSVAESLGADVVKQKFPMPVKGEKLKTYRESLWGIEKEGKLNVSFLKSRMPGVDQLLALEPEDPENVSFELNVKRLSFMSKVAPNILKGLSGGPKGGEEELLNITKEIMSAGLEGQIVGRNLWGRPIDEALGLNKKMVDIISEEQYHRKLKEPRFSGEYKRRRIGKMAKLYLLRHGEVENNVKNIFGGDTELTEKGIEQAREMA